MQKENEPAQDKQKKIALALRRVEARLPCLRVAYSGADIPARMCSHHWAWSVIRFQIDAPLG